MGEGMTAVLGAGSVEYNPEQATNIHEMIEFLQGLASEGYTHVIASSGNFRGPGYQTIPLECEGDA